MPREKLSSDNVRTAYQTKRKARKYLERGVLCCVDEQREKRLRRQQMSDLRHMSSVSRSQVRRSQTQTSLGRERTGFPRCREAFNT